MSQRNKTWADYLNSCIGQSVKVFLGGESFDGIVRELTADHLVLDPGQGPLQDQEYGIPLAAVRAVRRKPGARTDR